MKFVKVDGTGFPVAFFSEDIHGDEIPADAIKISNEDWEFLLRPENRRRAKFRNGRLVECEYSPDPELSAEGNARTVERRTKAALLENIHILAAAALGDEAAKIALAEVLAGG